MPPRGDMERAIARYQDEGLSGREALRRYRAAGGRVTTFTWQQAFTDRQDEISQGIEPERMPPWATRHDRRAPMRTTNPRIQRMYYWTILDIEEADGTIRDDQWYGFDADADLSDREAVRRAIAEWNAMMRDAPETGSLTGFAIGGRVQAVAPIVGR